MEKKIKQKRSGNVWGDKIKDDIKIGKYESKLNPDMRPCSDIKAHKSKILY